MPTSTLFALALRLGGFLEEILDALASAGDLTPEQRQAAADKGQALNEKWASLAPPPPS